MVFLRICRHRAAAALGAAAAAALTKTREEKAVAQGRRYENWKKKQKQKQKKQKQKQKKQQKKDAAAHRCLFNNVLVELRANKRYKYLRFADLRLHLDYLRRLRLPKRKKELEEDEQPVVVVIECNESLECNESFECNDSVDVECNESVEYKESFETVLVDCQLTTAKEVFAKLGNVVSVQVMAPETENDSPSTVSSTKKYEETLLYSTEKRLSGKKWRRVERRRLMNAADWCMSRRVRVDRAFDAKQRRDAWKRKRRMDRSERRQPATTDAEWRRRYNEYNAKRPQDSGMYAYIVACVFQALSFSN
jgi:hypothetical protein